MQRKKPEAIERNIRFSKESWESLEAYSRNTGMAKRAIVELAISEFLKKNGEEQKILLDALQKIHDDNLILQRIIAATVVAQAIDSVTSQKVGNEQFKTKVEEQASVYMRLAAGMERVLLDILAGKK